MADGVYQLDLRATDSEGNSNQSFQFEFTLLSKANPPKELALIDDLDRVTSNNQPIVTGIGTTGDKIQH